jgi:hypothetical protein
MKEYQIHSSFLARPFVCDNTAHQHDAHQPAMQAETAYRPRFFVLARRAVGFHVLAAITIRSAQRSTSAAVQPPPFQRLQPLQAQHKSGTILSRAGQDVAVR